MPSIRVSPSAFLLPFYSQFTLDILFPCGGIPCFELGRVNEYARLLLVAPGPIPIPVLLRLASFFAD